MTEDDDLPVPSPCRKQCQLHPIDKICLGCFRRIEEIADWARLDTPARREVVAALPARRAASEANRRSHRRWR